MRGKWWVMTVVVRIFIAPFGMTLWRSKKKSTEAVSFSVYRGQTFKQGRPRPATKNRDGIFPIKIAIGH